MPTGLSNKASDPTINKYWNLTIREAGEIAESLGVTLLTLLRS